MGSVHELRIEGKGNETELAMAELTRALRRAVESRVGADASFGEREAITLEVADAASRTYFRETLQQMADRYGEELLIDGVLYRQSHSPAEGHFHSLSGTVDVMRGLFRRVGERNGPTVVPLELEAGIVERATPALGYSIALNLGKETSRDYVESMAGAHRHVPSRSTVEGQSGTEAPAGQGSRLVARPPSLIPPDSWWHDGGLPGPASFVETVAGHGPAVVLVANRPGATRLHAEASELEVVVPVDVVAAPPDED